MNRGTEARNEKIFRTTVAGTGKGITVLPLNGSKARFPNPLDLRPIIETLIMPDHPERIGRNRRLNPNDITGILMIKNPTPEDEANLTAALFGATTIGVGSVEARIIELSLGRIPISAAFIDASGIDQIPTLSLLIVTDRPS